MKNKIYILHEYGEISHYLGLKRLADENGYVLIYREFHSLFNRQIRKFIKHPNYFYKWILNIIFLINLPFKRPSKIVLAMAPFNKDIFWLSVLLKKHVVYLHTSACSWDNKMPIYDSDFKTRNFWKTFLTSKVKHIFAVSCYTKNEIIKNNYAKEKNISVVNHAIKEIPNLSGLYPKNNNFIYVGRITSEKGIDELLSYFSRNTNLDLTLIGDGNLIKEVNEYIQEYHNIHYLGYINNYNILMESYKQMSFFILNSKHTKTWQELFGMALIEAMSCGCVPIVTNHPGPIEIVNNDYDGLICDEGHIGDGIERAVNLNEAEYLEMKEHAIYTSRQYTVEKIAKKWDKIFDDF